MRSLANIYIQYGFEEQSYFDTTVYTLHVNDSFLFESWIDEVGFIVLRAYKDSKLFLQTKVLHFDNLTVELCKISMEYQKLI